ncbi:MAG: penicillin-binding protein 2 [Fimbriimonadaceae bacterium]
MSVIHAPREAPNDLRSLLVVGVIGLVLLSYALRLWYVQVVESPSLAEAAESSSKIEVASLAPRGQILSREGLVVAAAAPTAALMARPKTALQDEAVLERVASAVGIDAKRLKRKILEHQVKGDLEVPVLVGLSPQAASWVVERRDALPGFNAATIPMRTYRDPVALSHILGYTGVPSERDLERLDQLGVTAAAYIGKDGLERTYEKDLMGQPGIASIRVDARRKPVATVSEEAATPGNGLVLGMSLKLQQYAMTKLAGRRGAIVALDPKTGDVLAMTSAPAFDASAFLGGISQSDYSALRDDPAKPLFHRAIGASYAPGSTFKIVTTLAAYRAGVFDPNWAASCRGYLQVGTKRFKCLGHHGAITFERAMTKSCNSYFAALAIKAGPEALLETCAELGMGSKIGLDLPGEAAGLIPTAEWWAKHRDRRFSLGDSANFGVGQGELACTPLQMACMMMTVANRGTRYQPRLVRALQGPREGDRPQIVPPQVAGTIEGDERLWSLLQSALRNVVTSGTARSANLPGFEVSGKTGSAENSLSRETHSWFVCYAPQDDPKIAMAVVVENAGHGGEIAAPIAGQVVRYYLDGLKSKPDKNEE